jgi:phytoene desaturase
MGHLYWLPDVFEEFFEKFNRKVNEMYHLVRLDPSYRVYFGPGDFIDVPAGMEAIYQLFEEWEPGSSVRLKKFMEDARYKYQLGMKKLVYKPSLSYFEFFEPWLLRGIFHGDFLRSVSSVVRKNFRNMRLVRILEFLSYFWGQHPGKRHHCTR